MATSLATLRTNAKQLADMDQSTGPMADAVWNVFLNNGYRRLWEKVALTFGDHFLTSADFTISVAGGTYTLATDFYQVRHLERNPDSDWPDPIPSFELSMRNAQCSRAFKLRGGVLEIQPKTRSTGDYRIWYVQGPTVLSADGDEIDPCVDRWHDYISMRAAAFALNKEESDTTFLDQQIRDYEEQVITPQGRRVNASGPPRAVDRELQQYEPWPFMVRES